MSTTADAGSTPSSTASTSLALVTADSAPDVTLPGVPSDFLPVPLNEFRGCRPRAAQTAVAPKAVTEVQNAPTFVQDFGPNAPGQTLFATCLGNAVDWRLLREETEAWADYVRTQDAIAWKVGLELMDQLEPYFNAAVTRDASVATRFPQLTRLFGTRSVIGKNAAAGRKKAAKAKAESAATAAASATPAAAATPATPAARVVTVTG